MMELQELKKSYDDKQKKYNLPSFKELNENFEIDKIDKDTDYLLRMVRKVAMEKILNSLTFLELLTNPSNTPRIYMSYVKSMTNNDKEMIEKLYEPLKVLSLESLDLEINYSEKSEAELIKKLNKTWEELKTDFIKLIARIKHPGIQAAKKEKSYFG